MSSVFLCKTILFVFIYFSDKGCVRFVFKCQTDRRFIALRMVFNFRVPVQFFLRRIFPELFFDKRRVLERFFPLEINKIFDVFLYIHSYIEKYILINYQ